MFKGKVIEESFHMSLITSPSILVDEVGTIDVFFPQGYSLLFYLFFPFSHPPSPLPPPPGTAPEKAKNSSKSSASCQVEEIGCGTMSGRGGGPPGRGGGRGEGGRVGGGAGGGVGGAGAEGEWDVKEFIVRNVKIEVSTRMSVVPLLFSLPTTVRLGEERAGGGGGGTGGEKGRGGGGRGGRGGGGRGRKTSAVAADPYYIVAITNESQWLVFTLLFFLSCANYLSDF